MLHETTVAWTRGHLAKTLPRRSWEETPDEYRMRLKRCAAYINEHFAVGGLCGSLPARLKELRSRDGDRLAK